MRQVRKIKGSIVLDNCMTVKEILETYDGVSVEQVILEDFVMFRLFEKEFLLVGPSKDDRSSEALIYLFNDEGEEFPHILLRDIEIDKDKALPSGKYRCICLYEQESIVNSLFSYEEKIIDAVDRLIELLTMTEAEKENEFQKEFLYYWSKHTSLQNADIYLKQDVKFTKLQKYCSEETTRYIENDIGLMDINSRDSKGNRKWQQHLETDAFFIPIIDNRGILPPYRNHPWTCETIKEIVYGKQINHISSETYKKLTSEIVSTQNVILVFEMKGLQSKVCFAVMVKCRNRNGRTLFEKLYEDSIDVLLFTAKRKDYLHLNEIIGNDSIINGKKVLLVGAGSLGSYVAPELVKNGASEIVVYDGDRLYDENIMRWAFGGVGIGSNKANMLAFWLEMIHPQVHIEVHEENINEKTLKKELQSVDIIIFTIGSSDIQLKLNRVLSEYNCQIPVFFVWLEAGGKYSHILTVNYEKQGCFECLFTNESGMLVNNKAMLNTEELIERSMVRNGCGGTRAAYGTAILLRTVSVLLNTMQKVLRGDIIDNTLIDIYPEIVSYPSSIIPMEACGCCGNRKKLQLCEIETSQ